MLFVARQPLTKGFSSLFYLPAAVPKQIDPETPRPWGLGAICSGFGSSVRGAYTVLRRLYGGSPCRHDSVLQNSRQMSRTAWHDLSQSRQGVPSDPVLVWTRDTWPHTISLQGRLFILWDGVPWLRVTWSPRGHLATSGNIFGCPKCEGCFWRLVARGQGWRWASYNTQARPPEWSGTKWP